MKNCWSGFIYVGHWQPIVSNPISSLTQPTQGAWRGRQNASMAIQGLDSFFKSMLTSSMGNDLLDKDLIPPQHSDRAHKLLAENLSGINHSYDVY